MLYSAAEKAYPLEAVLSCPIASGYCLAELDRYDESVEKDRRADALEPDNYEHLNDLGYTLLEAGKLDEAEAAPKRSISLAAEGYEFPINHLGELKEKRGRQGATSWTSPIQIICRPNISFNSTWLFLWRAKASRLGRSWH